MHTLVLSPSYEPVARITWQRAVTLLWENKVEVVEEYHDWTIRSVTVEIKVPAVIRFLKAIGFRKKAVKFSRENVWLRDKGVCQYCGEKVSRLDFTYDHVTPRVQGGITSWQNVVVCCTPCNQKKAGRTPEQAGMRLLTRPVKPARLPEIYRLTFTYQKGMPEVWKQWLRSVSYWNEELKEN